MEGLDREVRSVLESLEWPLHLPSVRLLCVDAPPSSGKSTKLVPAIWKHVTNMFTDITGIYVTRTASEAAWLHSYYKATGNMKTSINYTTKQWKQNIANGSDTVSMCGQTTMSRMLIKAPAGDQQVINDRLVLFFDIEPTPTAAGEIVLGQVLELFTKLRRNHLLMPVALVFLGWRLRPALCKAIESRLNLTMKMFKTDLPSPVQPIPRVANDDPLWKEPVWMRNTIISAFRQPSQGDNTCVVLFMAIEDARDSVVWPAKVILESDITIYYIANGTAVNEILEMTLDDGPKIVCIDPSVLCTLPPIKNIGLVISSCVVNEHVFDTSTSQYPFIRRDLSKLELYRQSSILAHQESPKFMLPRDEAWFAGTIDTLPNKTPAFLGELLVSGYDIWPDWQSHSMPIPILAEIDTSYMKEVRRRLVATQSIDGQGPTGFHLTEIGKHMVEMLRSTQGWCFDIHLAHMLARSLVMLKNSPHLLRLMIRLFVISGIEPRMLLQLSDKAAYERDNKNPSPIVSKAKTDCAGVGAQQCHNGSIWLALGLYENLVENDLISINPDKHFFAAADGSINFRRVHINEIHRRVKFFDSKYLPDAAGQTHPTSFLTERDRLQVYEILTWAYLDQLVFLNHPNDERNPPLVDITSGKRLEICKKFFIPVNTNSLDQIALLNPDTIVGCAGFYLKSIATHTTRNKPVGVLVMDLNLIPPSALKAIEVATGEKLVKLTRTTYQGDSNQ